MITFKAESDRLIKLLEVPFQRFSSGHHHLVYGLNQYYTQIIIYCEKISYDYE